MRSCCYFNLSLSLSYFLSQSHTVQIIISVAIEVRPRVALNFLAQSKSNSSLYTLQEFKSEHTEDKNTTRTMGIEMKQQHNTTAIATTTNTTEAFESTEQRFILLFSTVAISHFNGNISHSFPLSFPVHPWWMCMFIPRPSERERERRKNGNRRQGMFFHNWIYVIRHVAGATHERPSTSLSIITTGNGNTRLL